MNTNEQTVATGEVLARHYWKSRGMSCNAPDTCACGAQTFPDLGDEEAGERRARAFARHQAEMLAASGGRRD